MLFSFVTFCKNTQNEFQILNSLLIYCHCSLLKAQSLCLCRYEITTDTLRVNGSYVSFFSESTLEFSRNFGSINVLVVKEDIVKQRVNNSENCINPYRFTATED